MEIKNWIENSKLNKKQYESMYNESIEDNENFGEKQADRISWYKKFTKVKEVKYSKDDVKIKWFEDGNLMYLLIV